MLRYLWWTALLLLAGCAATPGASPHDMSKAGHDLEAAAHASTAEHHQALYDLNARKLREKRCRALLTAPATTNIDIGDICWTVVTNPTDVHLRHAAEHRRHAADHRAASAALRAAEAQACTGIAPDDRDLSPFEHPDDISAIAPLVITESSALSNLTSARTLGAVVTIRPVPGLTAERLQRLVDCHLARNASLGHVVPEMPDCPLVPKGVDARVTSSDTGFAVELRSESPATAREILARVRRLLPTPGAEAAPAAR